MNKVLLFILLICAPFISNAASNCFLISDRTGTILKQEGDCTARESPASTFKIPLALMGYDSGTIKSTTEPVWEYKPEYGATMAAHQRNQDPLTWMQTSAVWYSRVLLEKLGAKKFQSYVDMFDYGNKDLSGDPGKNNGLSQAWLGGSSLKISPHEQIVFLKNMLNEKWPLSADAYKNTRLLLSAGPLYDGWTLYGKTGTSHYAWYVGWIEKENKSYLFAYLLRHTMDKKTPVIGPSARDAAKLKLVEFLTAN